jgi:hypothetical protein
MPTTMAPSKEMPVTMAPSKSMPRAMLWIMEETITLERVS